MENILMSIAEQTIKFNKELQSLRLEWKTASLGKKKEIEKRASVIKSALKVFEKIKEKR